jgi:hypothetical protein
MSAFFAFGTFAASLSAVALLFPHSALDQIWRLNPDAKSAFLTIGSWAVLLMLVVAIACGLSAIGLWTRASGVVKPPFYCSAPIWSVT